LTISGRVGQAKQLGCFVEGFAGRVVQRLAEKLVLANAGNAHQLTVSARDEQGNEGKARRLARQQRRE
jgi:hypothetical protein